MVFYGIEDKAVLNPYTGIAYFKMGIFAPGLLAGSLIVLIYQLVGWPKHEHRTASYFCSSYLPFHPNKFFEKFQGNYVNNDSENVKVAELEKILMPKL